MMETSLEPKKTNNSVTADPNSTKDSTKESVPEALRKKVNGIITEIFEFDGSEELTPATRLNEDLGLDSLDAIDMVIAFQKQFNLKPDNEELQKIATLGDVYELVFKYYKKTV